MFNTGTMPTVTVVLVALAVVFAVLALRDYLVSEGKFTPARKAWLRISLIFCAIAIALFLWHTFVV